jgi:hypothetical protein
MIKTGSPAAPADLLTNQVLVALDPKVYCYTSRAPEVKIEQISPQTKDVALPTTLQTPFMIKGLITLYNILV